MKKVVSFSLWGDRPRYTVGAIRNAELMPEYYPDWVARFYVDNTVPAPIVTQLRELGAEVVVMPHGGDWRGLFWRFLAASDPTVDVMVSRDTDCRPSTREWAAVGEWLVSDKPFHIMRDHPRHHAAIMGGMWGVRAPLLRNMQQLLTKAAKADRYNIDQIFLREQIYPRVHSGAFVHDEFFEERPFPFPRQGDEFVGGGFNQHDEPFEQQMASLREGIAELHAVGSYLPCWRTR